jgi:general secretion pathway protein K
MKTRAATKSRPGKPRRRTRKPAGEREGFALLMSLVAIAILAVLITDLHETTGMGFAAANAQRDRLKAEYLAKSGVNLTRMLIGQEPTLRKIVDPMYRALIGRRAPQIPVWDFANTILKPFSDFEGSKADVATAGFDLNMSEGLGSTGGSFEVIGMAENTKINLNTRSLSDPSSTPVQVAMLLYSLSGGTLPSPNKYDALFSKFDERGRLTTRLDLIANVIDWWDYDEQRAQFDPALATLTNAGGEDVDYYRSRDDPYSMKNAPLDSLEELRLIRGIDDDFWATFIEPDPEDVRQTQVTIYGAGYVNPNGAEPRVLLSRVCSFPEVQQQLLCSDPTGQEALKFMTLVTFARSMAPIPWFSRPRDFVDFISGNERGLYGKMQSLMGNFGGGETMLFTPVVLPDDQDFMRRFRRAFTTRAEILSFEVTARVGGVQTRLRTVLQFDKSWVPPPPNAGAMPPLGIYYYYRID